MNTCATSDCLAEPSAGRKQRLRECYSAGLVEAFQCDRLRSLPPCPVRRRRRRPAAGVAAAAALPAEEDAARGRHGRREKRAGAAGGKGNCWRRELHVGTAGGEGLPRREELHDRRHGALSLVVGWRPGVFFAAEDGHPQLQHSPEQVAAHLGAGRRVGLPQHRGRALPGQLRRSLRLQPAPSPGLAAREEAADEALQQHDPRLVRRDHRQVLRIQRRVDGLQLASRARPRGLQVPAPGDGDEQNGVAHAAPPVDPPPDRQTVLPPVLHQGG
mmetsp:Transcript_14540/g.51113  ORF Transcript_14540/g.51113 Transcript_14540/m.51113 type:complete len:272 (+) Transcript_14540:2-817(+)